MSHTAQDVITQVRAIRMERGITQAEVAARMGRSTSFVQSIEYRALTDRRWGTVLDYADAVGVEISVTVTAKPEQ